MPEISHIKKRSDGSVLTKFKDRPRDYAIYFPKDSLGYSHYLMEGVEVNSVGFLCIFNKKKAK